MFFALVDVSGPTWEDENSLSVVVGRRGNLCTLNNGMFAAVVQNEQDREQKRRGRKIPPDGLMEK